LETAGIGTTRQIQAHQVLDETTWAFGEEMWARGNANVADFLAEVPPTRRCVNFNNETHLLKKTIHNKKEKRFKTLRLARVGGA
jgi:hypothetical protein